MSCSLQLLVDDIAVIDEPRDKPDRPHLAYQRRAEADLIPLSVLQLMFRIAIAAVFWSSGLTKIAS